MSRKQKTLGTQVIEGLKEALAWERGERKDVKLRRVPITARRAQASPAPGFASARIVRLRKRLGLSQPIFAQALNVSPETVKAWEQGKRSPDGAALRLLELAEERPALLLGKLRAAI